MLYITGLGKDQRGKMNNKIYVKSSDGINLAVYEFGNPQGRPLIFLHGMCQSYLSWKKQFNDELLQDYRLIIPELRGHGVSDKPVGIKSYLKSSLWADDLHLIMEHFNLVKPVVVAWSYGGYMLGDYLSKYGQERLAGINFVAAGVKLNKKFEMIGEGFLAAFPDMVSSESEKQARGILNFIKSAFEELPLGEELQEIIGYNSLVPPVVILHLGSRNINYTAELQNLSLPVLVSISTKDKIIDPAMGKFIFDNVNQAKLSSYEDCGHHLFYEEAERFNHELVEFVTNVWG